QLIWKEAPRDVFKSVGDWKRWHGRYRGKPIDETTGALPVALTDNKPTRRWRVHVILAARWHFNASYAAGLSVPFSQILACRLSLRVQAFFECARPGVLRPTC